MLLAGISQLLTMGCVFPSNCHYTVYLFLFLLLLFFNLKKINKCRLVTIFLLSLGCEIFVVLLPLLTFSTADVV